MLKKRLGRTGLEVSIIGFGGLKLPVVDKGTASKVLNRALDLGINYFDTARGYEDSEEKMGCAMSERRDEYYISTKSPAMTAGEMEADIRESLRKLGTDYIDIYMCHNLRHPSDYEKAVGPGGAMEALREAKDEGVVGHIGFSCHRFHETMERGIRSGLFEAVMLSYNVLNDELVDEKVLPLAKSLDVGVIAMKPLAGGALASPPSQLGAGSGLQLTAQKALRFVLANDAVDVVIPGMMSVREVEENARVGETFPFMAEDEKAKLVEAAEALGKGFCRGCGYCQPCPQGVRVPIILRQLAYCKNYGLDEWAKGRYSMVEVKADACTECGECKGKCPYGLDVPEMLKEAHRLLAQR